MTEHFTQEYTETDDYAADGKTFCMRCHTQVLGWDYVELPKRNSPGEKVSVLARKKFPNYRLVKVKMDVGGKELPGHLVMCADCENAPLSADEMERASGQIVRGHERELRFNGYAISDADPVRSLKVLGRI